MKNFGKGKGEIKAKKDRDSKYQSKHEVRPFESAGDSDTQHTGQGSRRPKQPYRLAGTSKLTGLRLAGC